MNKLLKLYWPWLWPCLMFFIIGLTIGAEIRSSQFLTREVEITQQLSKCNEIIIRGEIYDK